MLRVCAPEGEISCCPAFLFISPVLKLLILDEVFSDRVKAVLFSVFIPLSGPCVLLLLSSGNAQDDFFRAW
jgi:hypothetical protein